MSPFSMFESIDNLTFTSSGLPVFGGMNQSDEFTVPPDRFALVYFAMAEIAGGPVTLSLLNRELPDLKLTATGNCQPGDIPGAIYLRPGDVLRWQYSTSDAGAYATFRATMILFKAK